MLLLTAIIAWSPDDSYTTDIPSRANFAEEPITRLSTQALPFHTNASYCEPVSRTTSINSSDAGSAASSTKLQLLSELTGIEVAADQEVPSQTRYTGSGLLVHDTAIKSPDTLSYLTATPRYAGLTTELDINT